MFQWFQFLKLLLYNPSQHSNSISYCVLYYFWMSFFKVNVCRDIILDLVDNLPVTERGKLTKLPKELYRPKKHS